MEFLQIAAIVFTAILVHTLAGFGAALVAMPLLIGFLDPIAAASLVSLIGLTIQSILLRRYWRQLRPRALWRLMLATLIGIPLGVEVVVRLDTTLVLGGLGLFLIAYALYTLIGPRLPAIAHPRWSYMFGFASGLLGGAYNMAGPPYVIYGMCREWTPDQFRINLQMLFMVSGTFVGINHLVRGHYDAQVLQGYLIALPMIVLGALVGMWLDRFVNQQVFRRILLVMLLIIGVQLILASITTR
ncbi:MAG: sulfite exporter TauE/SafE family protein [Chloroflexi bacterium]|nr:sulfite exporter TauE/SafE family protein [Chloroflexota bacterium]